MFVFVILKSVFKFSSLYKNLWIFCICVLCWENVFCFIIGKIYRWDGSGFYIKGIGCYCFVNIMII